MREYYPKSSELPKDVYEQVKGILRGYDRLINERYALICSTPQKPEGGNSGAAGDPTAAKALKLAHINERLRAIDQAQMWMRGKLSDVVTPCFDPLRAFWSYDYYNAQHYRVGAKDLGPSPRTWKRYRIRFAAIVAQNLKIF